MSLGGKTRYDIPGKTIPDLRASLKFPDQPDNVVKLATWEVANNTGNNYGVRLRGYVTPPVSGDYVFYLCSDDDSELYVSSDETAGNGKLVAKVNGFRQPLRWETLPPESISEPLSLEGGKRYWVETLFREDAGADHLAVTWQMPGMPPPKNGAPPIAGEFLDPAP